VDTAIRQTSVDSGRAMGSAGKGSGGDTEDNELYKLNQVFYRAIPSLTTVTKRTLIRSNFQLPAYANLQNQTIQCVFNTGELFVNGSQSFLMMQFGINIPDKGAGVASEKLSDIHAFLGPGGILGIIDEVWLTSASGTEICREQNKGLQIAHYLQNTLPPTYTTRNGEQEGLPFANSSDLFSGRGYCRGTGGGFTANTPEGAGPILNRRGVYLSGGTTGIINEAIAQVRPAVYTDQGAVDVTFQEATNVASKRVPGTAPIFAIPMNHLLGVFNPYLKVLLPGLALAGATLSIRIKNLQEPLIMTGAGLQANSNGADDDNGNLARATYARGVANTAQIYQIYILWDTYQMNDSVIKKINEISANRDGLTMMFDTFDWSSTPAPSTQVEAQVSQARSRIKMSFCVVRPVAAISNPYVPSLCSEAGVRRSTGPFLPNQELQATTSIPTVTTYQAILGSLYFPQQPMNNITEYYFNQLYMFGKTYRDEGDNSCLGIEDFGGAVGPASNYTVPSNIPYAPTLDNTWAFPYGMGLYGLTAERSSLLQLTGLTISNARLLRHRFTFSGVAVGGLGRNIDVFTQFTRQMKVYLGGRVVMRE